MPTAYKRLQKMNLLKIFFVCAFLTLLWHITLGQYISEDIIDQYHSTTWELTRIYVSENWILMGSDAGKSPVPRHC